MRLRAHRCSADARREPRARDDAERCAGRERSRRTPFERLRRPGHWRAGDPRLQGAALASSRRWRSRRTLRRIGCDDGRCAIRRGRGRADGHRGNGRRASGDRRRHAEHGWPGRSSERIGRRSLRHRHVASRIRRGRRVRQRPYPGLGAARGHRDRGGGRSAARTLGRRPRGGDRRRMRARRDRGAHEVRSEG